MPSGVRAVRTLRRKASPESLELLEQLETLLEDRSRLDKFSADAFGPTVLDLEDYDEGLRSDDPDDLEVVLDRARAAQDALDAFCLAAAAAAGLGPKAYERARRKGFGRAADKVRADYDGDAQRLRDGARGSLVAETEGDLARLLRTLMRSNGDAARVVRFANRFRRPPFTGYRDALFTVRLGDGGRAPVLAEVQVHYGPLADRRDSCARSYEAFRAYFRRGRAAEKLDVLRRLAERASPDFQAGVEAALAGDDGDLLASLADVGADVASSTRLHYERMQRDASAVLRAFDESHRFVPKSAEST